MENKITLNKQQKNDIRKLLRNEYGGKNCTIENYTSLIKSLSEKYSLDIYALTTFMKEYIIDADGKVYIFSKKIISSRAKKTINKPIIKTDIDTNNNNTKPDILESINKPIIKTNPDTNNNTINNTESNINNEPIKTISDNNIKSNINKKPISKSNSISNKKSISKPTKTNNDTKSDNLNKKSNNHNTEYCYPKQIINYTNKKYSPYGTQWIHDIQTHDILTPDIIRRQRIVDNLLQIKCPDQGTAGWFEMRHGKITASDGGCVLGVNEHEPKYRFILKKIVGTVFKSNKFCYHGKKYENIATMIYEYRFNVSIKSFGLIGHPVYKFLGASPDGIIGLYKHDKKHFTKYVGRMLEIKCPLVRKIESEGDIFDICPKYYWVQVQLQLECCNLDDCDFLQCKITEYETKDAFIKDTDPTEPFRSKLTGFEKGCVIQLLPKNKMKDILDLKYWDTVYNNSVFIYPPKIEMTPMDYDIWISETLSNFDKSEYANEYYFDRIFYWRLERSNCLTILRDKKWFTDNLPELDKMWKYVEFFRENQDKKDLLLNYIESMSLKKNKTIMKLIDDLYTIPKDTPDEKNMIDKLCDEIKKNNEHKEHKIKEKQNNRIDNTVYMF